MKKYIAPLILVYIINIAGCTVYLPPGKEPIPAADPIPASPNTATNKPSSFSTQVEKTKADTANTAKKEPTRQEQVFYVVKKNDTVFEVMRKTGVNWQKIIRLNHLQPPNYTIHPGQSLRIK